MVAPYRIRECEGEYGMARRSFRDWWTLDAEERVPEGIVRPGRKPPLYRLGCVNFSEGLDQGQGQA